MPVRDDSVREQIPTTGLSTSADTAPWPVIDPAEHGHICAHDQPVRYQHPAHDHHAEPGNDHKCVGPSALVGPAIGGMEPPPGQPPAQLPRPASLARACRRGRLSGCICRHRHHTCQAGSPAPGRILRPLAQWLARRDAGCGGSREIMDDVARNPAPAVHTGRSVLPRVPALSSPPGSLRVILTVRLRGNRDELA